MEPHREILYKQYLELNHIAMGYKNIRKKTYANVLINLDLASYWNSLILPYFM